jgi:hypothetical protein
MIDTNALYSILFPQDDEGGSPVGRFGHADDNSGSFLVVQHFFHFRSVSLRYGRGAVDVIRHEVVGQLDGHGRSVNVA